MRVIKNGANEKDTRRAKDLKRHKLKGVVWLKKQVMNSETEYRKNVIITGGGKLFINDNFEV